MSVDPPRIAELAARSRAVLERAGAHLRKTPLVPCPRLSEAIGGEVHLKLESLQATGSFKLRGAFARLTAESPTPARVVTASTGNHGAAVAHAARSLGIEAVVYVPRTAAAAKVDKIRTLGALVREAGEDCVEAEAAARGESEAEGLVYVSPYNDPEVVAGQGTLGLELVDEVPGGVDAVSISVGGGGLISGTAAALKAAWADVRIIGASPERSTAMLRSVEAGRILPDEGLETLSDGTAGGIEDDSCTFQLCRDLVDEWVSVPEEEIAAEMRAALIQDHLVWEGAAAVAAAGLVRAARERSVRTAIVVVCGGNVAPGTLAGLLEQSPAG